GAMVDVSSELVAMRPQESDRRVALAHKWLNLAWIENDTGHWLLAKRSAALALVSSVRSAFVEPNNASAPLQAAKSALAAGATLFRWPALSAGKSAPNGSAP